MEATLKTMEDGPTRRTNRCKSTIDTSAYYSKKLIWRIIDPYLINTLLFVIIFLPILIYSIITFPIYIIACKIIINSYTFCYKQHWLIIQSNYKLKGIRGVICDSILIYALQSFMIISLSLDNLLFPAIKNIKIKSPVFITGCARSGTTFTHRILTTPPPNKRKSSNLVEDSKYVIHALWEILCPSILIKYFLYHIIQIIDKIISYCNGYNKLRGAYDYQLNGEAAEEGLFAMHCMGGDFWVEFLPVGYWFDIYSKYIGIGVKDHWKDGHVRLLRQLLQRQIYWSGKTQIIAKSPSLCWFLDDIINEFKDCRIILLIRDPYEMVCSNLSLFNETWKTLYGDKYMRRDDGDIWNIAFKSLIWRRSEQTKRYLNYINTKNQNKNILIVRYNDIKNNLSRTYDKCMEHCNLIPCNDTKQWIKEKEIKQKSRKRTHKIRPISSYDLDPKLIKQQFQSVIKRWNFKSVWK